LVVITGGEPFRQNLYQLVHHLRESYITVQIESNGTAAMQDLDKWVHHLFWGPTRPQVVVSPKAGKVHMDLRPWITAYKYVLDANHIDSKDGLPESVLGMPAKPARPHEGFDGPVYVQPAEESCIKYAMHEGGIHVKQLHDVANQANVEAVVKSAMTHGYTVCLQTHKILEVA
jgi:organic radical activating enzyme